MQEPRKRLAKLLETHLCDAVDDDKHESELNALTESLFEGVDLSRRTAV